MFGTFHCNSFKFKHKVDLNFKACFDDCGLKGTIFFHRIENLWKARA